MNTLTEFTPAKLQRLTGKDRNGSDLSAETLRSGTLGDLVAAVLAEPPAQAWRYLISTDFRSFIGPEEIAFLGGKFSGHAT